MFQLCQPQVDAGISPLIGGELPLGALQLNVVVGWDVSANLLPGVPHSVFSMYDILLKAWSESNID